MTTEITNAHIYSLNGFDNVTISGTSVESIGTMHCGHGYSSECVIKADDPNICDPLEPDQKCNELAYTVVQTLTPTAQTIPSTNNPITKYPTFAPAIHLVTFAPTHEPTMNAIGWKTTIKPTVTLSATKRSDKNDEEIYLSKLVHEDHVFILLIVVLSIIIIIMAACICRNKISTSKSRRIQIESIDDQSRSEGDMPKLSEGDIVTLVDSFDDNQQMKKMVKKMRISLWNHQMRR